MHVLIVKHIENEAAGTILTYLDEVSIPYRHVRLYASEPLPGSLDDISHVVVMGGTMNVYEEDKYPFLRDENVFIQKALAAKIPFLGICLGGQLLAKACGAKVRKNHIKEIGVCEVEIYPVDDKDELGMLKDAPQKFPTVQWHGDTFDIPEGGTLVATSKDCTNQAFKLGENAYGFQFHPEVDLELISDWYDDVDYKDEIIKEFLSVREDYDKIAWDMYKEFFKKG